MISEKTIKNKFNKRILEDNHTEMLNAFMRKMRALKELPHDHPFGHLVGKLALTAMKAIALQEEGLVNPPAVLDYLKRQYLDDLLPAVLNVANILNDQARVLQQLKLKENDLDEKKRSLTESSYDSLNSL